jgi:hypothetical protein
MSDRPSSTNVVHIFVIVAVLVVSLAAGVAVANGRLSLTAASMASAPPEAASNDQKDHQNGDRKDKSGKDKERQNGDRKDEDRKDDQDDDRSNASGDRQGAGADVTLTGTVGTQTTARGATIYTLDTGAAVLRLDAGPAWFYPSAYPLAPYVGKQVTVVGQHRQGSRQVDVLSIDGTVIREPGRPPWAGGKQKQERGAASPGPSAASPSPSAAAPSPGTTSPSPSTAP